MEETASVVAGFCKWWSWYVLGSATLKGNGLNGFFCPACVVSAGILFVLFKPLQVLDGGEISLLKLREDRLNNGCVEDEQQLLMKVLLLELLQEVESLLGLLQNSVYVCGGPFQV